MSFSCIGLIKKHIAVILCTNSLTFSIAIVCLNEYFQDKMVAKERSI